MIARDIITLATSLNANVSITFLPEHKKPWRWSVTTADGCAALKRLRPIVNRYGDAPSATAAEEAIRAALETARPGART